MGVLKLSCLDAREGERFSRVSKIQRASIGRGAKIETRLRLSQQPGFAFSRCDAGQATSSTRDSNSRGFFRIALMTAKVEIWLAGRASVEPCGMEEWLSVVLVLAVLGQAILLETPLGILLVVDETLPAFVGPGGGAKLDKWYDRHSYKLPRCDTREHLVNSVEQHFDP